MKLAVEEKLIVALDTSSLDEALQLVEQLGGRVITFKVGKELFVNCGIQIIQELHKLGKKVFLDLKFHDIPNTVAGAGVAAVRHGVFMFNVHAAGGQEMMVETVKRTNREAELLNRTRPLIIGVTVLTSFNDKQLQEELGLNRSVQEQVALLAQLAKKSGLDGVVSSPQEVKLIKQLCGSDFLTVVPGVRPLWARKNDQKRVMTPEEAVRAGADFLVVGRPITQAERPVLAAEKILKEIKEGMGC
ncbi:MAG TPA: orotidine-5'-phosphate decarboxylase [Clostridia bacterium]|nr:orotidine-5'-phosphate decarboxylase [Clostridia bacterium]